MLRPTNRDGKVLVGRGAPREVPSQMAPQRCVTTQEMITALHVQLIGRDLSGVIRVVVQLERDERGVTWFERVVRHYLAWRYGACDIRLLG